MKTLIEYFNAIGDKTAAHAEIIETNAALLGWKGPLSACTNELERIARAQVERTAWQDVEVTITNALQQHDPSNAATNPLGIVPDEIGEVIDQERRIVLRELLPPSGANPLAKALIDNEWKLKAMRWAILERAMREISDLQFVYGPGVDDLAAAL